jgi:hypothetical protein
VSHPVEWATASPVWEGTPRPPAPDPMLLRFASDSFMDDLQALLDHKPASLAALRAPKESFRARPIGKDDSWQSPVPPLLKLYQPIHGHFYLVAATLVCRIPGFPDHEVQPAQQEKVSFVVRRLGPAGELAWSADPVKGKGWVSAKARELAPYEELHPLAPVNFTVAGGRRRRLFVGLIPTATRDTYKVTRALDPYPARKADNTAIDTRPTEAVARVVDALASIADLKTPPPDEAAHFALLDLADFLHSHVDASTWSALTGTSRPASPGPVQSLYDRLSRPVGTTLTLRTAMASALAQTDSITGESAAAVSFPASLPADLQVAARALVPTGETPRGAALRQAVVDVLPASGATTASEGLEPSAVEVPKLAAVPSIDGESPPRFRLRCVYQRPECRSLHPPLVSEATETFTFAPFFDFDAPARPIRIPLPVDTSIKDLRKFRKNVSFVISEQLKNQMNQVKGLKDAMEGNLAGADSATVGFGLICSFSIPIITICALIVLMIFLYLLNIVFWWVPFFRLCFPFPKRAS